MKLATLPGLLAPEGTVHKYETAFSTDWVVYVTVPLLIALQTFVVPVMVFGSSGSFLAIVIVLVAEIPQALLQFTDMEPSVKLLSTITFKVESSSLAATVIPEGTDQLYTSARFAPIAAYVYSTLLIGEQL